MGGHYGSVQLRTVDRQRVLAAAEAVAAELKIKCLVGPALNGWVGVYPEGNGQDQTVGERIAARVGGQGLHVLVHDDDVLAYWLWSDGVLVDRYWSSPGYFGEENRAEEEPLVGDAGQFAFVLDDAGQSGLAELLNRDDGPTFEYERLERFGKLLGIANALTAYEYLKGGETDDVTGWPRRFKEVPAKRVSSERTQRSAEAKRIAAERGRLREAGLLLVSEEETDRGPIACAAADGFIVVWPDHSPGKNGKTTVEYHRVPWGEPVPAEGMELPPQPHVTDIAADATGRRLAMAAGKLVRVWDWLDGRWRHVLDVPERDLTIGVALSDDGARVAHLSRSEVVVTEVATGHPVARLPGQTQVKQLAFSPDGQWLVIAGDVLGLVPLADPTRRRDCLVGGPRTPPDVPAQFQLRITAETDIDAIIASQRDMFEQALARQDTSAKWTSFPCGPEQLEQMRSMMERQLAELRERLARQQREGPPVPRRVGSEFCFGVGFDPDGRQIWVASSGGIRIYDWAAVASGTGDELPLPVCAAELPATPRMESSQREARYVYSAVLEPAGAGLLFGGLSDELYRLDRSTGVVQRLAIMPGGGNVHSLSITPDGSTLGIRSNWWTLESMRRNQSRQAWEVWSLPNLVVSASLA